MTVVWLLNPDAEAELAHHARARPGPYKPRGATLAAMKERRPHFVELTQHEPALLYGERWTPEGHADVPTPWALPWCATPSIPSWAERLGLRLVRLPRADVVIRANDKTKLESWGLPCVPGRKVVRSPEEARQHLSGHPMRCKRSFGWAGRGQRRLTSTLSPDDERWLEDSVREDALVMEPELDAPRLISAHYMVSEETTLRGELVGFACDRYGSPLGWDESPPQTNCASEIERAGLEACKRLVKAGYRGPVGIDFALTPENQAWAIDLNARFTLGSRRGLRENWDQAISLYTGWA